jgi:hypothetical protein
MKVIKKENVSDWRYKHICENCDSELEVEAHDVKHRRYDGDIREPGYDSYSAICEVCTNSFNIPVNKIPKLVQLEARDKASKSYGHW